MANRWTELAERLEKATGPDRELDYRILMGVHKTDGRGYLWDPHGADHRFTSSIDATVALIHEQLPGWWWKTGLCYLSGDATLGPDYNDPLHSERLFRQFPQRETREDSFPEDFDVDLRPGRTVERAAIALCIAFCQAMAAQDTPALVPDQGRPAAEERG